MRETFDYVIVGAGSAGSVMANRLSSDPSYRVLLLEAGGSDRGFRIQMPAAFSMAMGSPTYDWCYQSETEPGLDDRIISYPRGKVLGGSSSINAMCFTRGHPDDYDQWAGNGLPDWSYAHCLPYFKKMEMFEGGADSYRGREGPLHVSAPKVNSVLTEAFIDACEQAGNIRSPDTNGWCQDGVGISDQTIYGGRRVSAASAYLHPALDRENLTIRKEVTVNRLVLRSSKVVAVDYIRDGQAYSVDVSLEVIVCAGSVNSPKLMMLSGIGDETVLRNVGIKPYHHLPSVGRYLQDHLDIYICHKSDTTLTKTPALRWYNRCKAAFQWFATKTGDAATNHFEALCYLRSSDELARPNILSWFCPILVNPDGSSMGYPHGYFLMLMQQRPTSRGFVSLRTSKPTDPPIISAQFLSDKEDLKVLREAVRVGRKVLSQPAFQRFRGTEISPGACVITDQQIDNYVRQSAKSTRHPSCTCRMGIDPVTSVVDSEARVHGLEGVRIVDASIMPQIVGGALNATTIMLAEKLADCILHNSPEPPLMEEALVARQTRAT